MLKVYKNNNIKIKCKINLYSLCTVYGFKTFETIDEKEYSDLLRVKDTSKAYFW